MILAVESFFIYVNMYLEKKFCFSLLAQAHSSVERAGLLGGVQFRLLDTDSKHQLRGETLADAIREDKEKGLIPFYVRVQLFSFSQNISIAVKKADFYFLIILGGGYFGNYQFLHFRSPR